MAEGCSTHTARIMDRDGAVVCEADALVEVQWGRVLDDTATARATINPRGNCTECVGSVRTWRHRLVIWRGTEGSPVFDGPIVVAEWSLGELVIQAFDQSAWLERRVPHTDLDYADTDLVHIARSLITDAFSSDDPGHSVEIVSLSGILGDRSYEKDVGQTWDHLRALSDTGIDWTTIGTRFVLMGEEFCEVVGSLSDDDFAEGLSVIEDGVALSTRDVVFGDEDLDVKGEFGGSDPYYGLLETTRDEDSILDDGSATAAARAKVRATNPAPVFVDTGQGVLAPTALVDVNRLVPGYCLAIATTITGRTVIDVQKIGEIAVTEGAGGEQIRLTTFPTGQTT